MGIGSTLFKWRGDASYAFSALTFKTIVIMYLLKGRWRRRRDSNPRDDSSPTHFPGVRLRPLGHVSDNRFNYLFPRGQGLKLKIEAH